MSNNAPMNPIASALRGLALGLSLSFLNLIGLFFMLLLLGGLGNWSTMQFVGAFGLFEVATAFAFIFCPNLWRMPVIEAELGSRDNTKLAASAILIPHWAGGAKAIAGVAMLIIAARSEGVGAETVSLLPFAVAVGILVIAISAAAARFGVAHPEFDVVHVVIRRPKRKDVNLPGLSLSAAFLQILLGAFTLPTVKILPPSSLYHPEIGPSTAFLAGVTLAASASVLGALWVWRGRISIRAPRKQQQKAEERV
jgi:hypothetical protein